MKADMKYYYLIENDDTGMLNQKYIVETDEIADLTTQNRVVDTIRVRELRTVEELGELVYPKILKNVFDRQMCFLRQTFNFPNGDAKYNGWTISKWEFDIIERIIELAGNTKEYIKYCEI